MPSKKAPAIGSVIAITAGVLAAGANATQIASFFKKDQTSSTSPTFATESTSIAATDITSTNTGTASATATTSSITTVQAYSTAGYKSETLTTSSINTQPSSTTSTEVTTSPKTEYAYSVRTLTGTINDTGANEVGYIKMSSQTFAVDTAANQLYYIEGKKIYCCDIASGESTLLQDFEGDTNYRLYLVYNPYNGNTYCCACNNNSNQLFEVHSHDAIVWQSKNASYTPHPNFFRFTSNDTLCAVKSVSPVAVGSTSCNEAYRWNIIDNTIIEGYIKLKNEIYACNVSVFSHDDCFYWIGCDGNGHYKNFPTYISKTISDIGTSRDKSGTVLGTFNADAIYTSTDDAFILSDGSIYRINVNVLTDIYNENSVETGTGIFDNNSQRTPDDALECVLDCNQIKQTGTNNYGTIQHFAMLDDGSAVIFDSFDSTYKLIEHISPDT